MTGHDKLCRAEGQVDAMIGVCVHLAVFAVVMGILFAINVQAGGGWWVQWPALGWGFGVLGHALAVFGRTPGAVARWRLPKIHQLQAGPR